LKWVHENIPLLTDFKEMSLKVCKMRFLAVFEPLLQVKAYSCGQKNSRTTARQNPWVGEFIL